MLEQKVDTSTHESRSESEKDNRELESSAAEWIVVEHQTSDVADCFQSASQRKDDAKGEPGAAVLPSLNDKDYGGDAEDGDEDDRSRETGCVSVNALGSWTSVFGAIVVVRVVTSEDLIERHVWRAIEGVEREL